MLLTDRARLPWCHPHMGGPSAMDHCFLIGSHGCLRPSWNIFFFQTQPYWCFTARHLSGQQLFLQLGSKVTVWKLWICTSVFGWFVCLPVVGTSWALPVILSNSRSGMTSAGQVLVKCLHHPLPKNLLCVFWTQPISGIGPHWVMSSRDIFVRKTINQPSQYNTRPCPSCLHHRASYWLTHWILPLKNTVLRAGSRFGHKFWIAYKGRKFGIALGVNLGSLWM